MLSVLEQISSQFCGEKPQIEHCVCLKKCGRNQQLSLIDHSAHNACLFLVFVISGSVYSASTHSLFPDTLLISELRSGCSF